MKLFIKFVVLAALFGALALAQQEGSVAIAEAIVPASQNVVSDFVGCVKELTQTGISSKDALKACKEASKVQAKVVSDVSDDASGATKASRPVVVSPYSYGGYGYGYSYRPYTPPTPRYHVPRYHVPRYSRPQK